MAVNHRLERCFKKLEKVASTLFDAASLLLRVKLLYCTLH